VYPITILLTVSLLRSSEGRTHRSFSAFSFHFFLFSCTELYPFANRFPFHLAVCGITPFLLDPFLPRLVYLLSSSIKAMTMIGFTKLEDNDNQFFLTMQIYIGLYPTTTVISTPKIEFLLCP
jgi:hypothetical protein